MAAFTRLATITPLVKKGWLSRAQRADVERASHALRDYYDGAGFSEAENDRVPVTQVIYTPHDEFEELTFELPDFDDVPLFNMAWHNQGRPTTFVVFNISTGDRIYIDTQGYEYARYRAAVLKIEEVEVATVA
jgi:hypothetical protein